MTCCSGNRGLVRSVFRRCAVPLAALHVVATTEAIRRSLACLAGLGEPTIWLEPMSCSGIAGGQTAVLGLLLLTYLRAMMSGLPLIVTVAGVLMIALVRHRSRYAATEPRHVEARTDTGFRCWRHPSDARLVKRLGWLIASVLTFDGLAFVAFAVLFYSGLPLWNSDYVPGDPLSAFAIRAIEALGSIVFRAILWSTSITLLLAAIVPIFLYFRRTSPRRRVFVLSLAFSIALEVILAIGEESSFHDALTHQDAGQIGEVAALLASNVVHTWCVAMALGWFGVAVVEAGKKLGD